jgi:hypothetical protein
MVSVFHIHACIGSASITSTLLNPLHLPSLDYCLPLMWSFFYIPICQCLSVCSLFKGVLSWCFTCKCIVLLISLTPSITLPVILFSVHLVVLYSCTDVIHFSTIHCLSFSCFPPQLVFSHSTTVGNMSYIYIIMDIWSCLYLCISLCFGYMFHIWEKTCDLCLLKLAYFI